MIIFYVGFPFSIQLKGNVVSVRLESPDDATVTSFHPSSELMLSSHSKTGILEPETPLKLKLIVP